MDWAIYFIIVSQIVVLYWFAAPINARLTYHVFLGRNPQYCIENEAFLRRFPPPRFSIWLAYAMGAGWIGVSIYALFLKPSNGLLVVGLVAPMLCWIVLCFGYIGVEYHRMFKKIPLPGIRRASLGRRSLRDYMNPMWAYLAYAAIFLIAVIYVIGYLSGRIPVHVAIGRMAGLAIIAVVGSLCLLYSIRRKHQPIDDELGPIYRKIEVVGVIPLMLMAVPIGGWRILQDFYGVQLFTDLAFFAVSSVLLQAGLLVCIRHPAVTRLVSESRRGM